MYKIVWEVFDYGKRYGIKNLFFKILEQIFTERVPSEPSPEPPISNVISDVFKQRFPNIEPLPICSYSDSSAQINLVTDSLLDDSFYGGVATAIIFAILLANSQDKKLRIITRHQNGGKDNFKALLDRENLRLTQSVEFVFCDLNDNNKFIDASNEDLFITTSWWTTASVKKSVPHNKIIYILQEDERMFYPLGDEHLLCSETIASPEINLLINTKLLYTHLINDGFENILTNGLYFEPSFNKSLYIKRENDIQKTKQRLFFYARPNHARNLFFRGMEVLDKALQLGIIDLELWEIYFLGTTSDEIQFSNGYIPKTLPNLAWKDYVEFLKTIDLGLSLMYTPHPSYPPLDLSTTGSVVVTNKFKNKNSLENYSKNILVSDLDVQSLVSSLEKGIALSLNEEQRQHNYINNNIKSDWNHSFESAIKRYQS